MSGSLNRARLTPERRRKNRLALREELLGPEGTIARPPGDPHRDLRGGLGFLEVGSELIEMDADVIEYLTADVSPRRRRPEPPPSASRVSAWDVYARLIEALVAGGGDAEADAVDELLGQDPDPTWVVENAHLLFERRTIEEAGVADLIAPGGFAAGSPGIGSSGERRVRPSTVAAERDRARRRGAARDALELGRADAGSKGDVDLPDAGVGESRLSEAAWSAVEAGLITEEEAHEASGHASGDRDGSGLREAGSTPAGRTRASTAALERRRAADVDHARRLQAGAERVCQCSKDGGGDRVSCGGLCSMAERHSRRVARRYGLSEEERREAGLRDWSGSLSG